jgi:glutaredoxin
MRIILLIFIFINLTSCINQEKIHINLMNNKEPFENIVQEKNKTGIVFWKANCGPCIKELKLLNQKNNTIIAINVNKEESLEKEVKKLERKIGTKLNNHINVQKNDKLVTVVKKIGVNFVPFTVVVENQKVSTFHAGYTDSL